MTESNVEKTPHSDLKSLDRLVGTWTVSTRAEQELLREKLRTSGWTVAFS